MIETKYQVKLVSQPSVIAFIITILISFFTAVVFIPRPISTLVLLIIISSFALVWYILWQTFVIGKTEWILDNNGVSVIWTKRPLERTKDLVVKWEEIEKIYKGLDTKYYHLKIELNSGDTLSFFHDYLTTKDDFENLIKALNQNVANKKLQPTNGFAASGA